MNLTPKYQDKLYHVFYNTLCLYIHVFMSSSCKGRINSFPKLSFINTGNPFLILLYFLADGLIRPSLIPSETSRKNAKISNLSITLVMLVLWPNLTIKNQKEHTNRGGDGSPIPMKWLCNLSVYDYYCTEKGAADVVLTPRS